MFSNLIDDILSFPNTIFYINHYYDPFLFYCLTGNFLGSTIFSIIWEIIEYLLFSW